MKLPAGHSFKGTPEGFRIEHRCFSFFREVKRRSRKLVMKSSYERRCVEVSVEDYEEFREVVQRAAANSTDFVSFSRGRSS